MSYCSYNGTAGIKQGVRGCGCSKGPPSKVVIISEYCVDVLCLREAVEFITDRIATAANVRALTSQGSLLTSLSITAEITDKVVAMVTIC